jgi:large subunit ribosomal protein L27
MAQKKASGSSSNGRDSIGRRLGLKLSDGQFCQAGSVIVRQRGTRYLPGSGVGCGKDHTLFSLVNGIVFYLSKAGRTVVSVAPLVMDDQNADIVV